MEDDKSEKRTTLVHDRFQACCNMCGFLSGHLTKQAAIEACRNHQHHGQRIEVWDAMAKDKSKDIVWQKPPQ